jgi:tetratricopeptide (TPR) repeat protein
MVSLSWGLPVSVLAQAAPEVMKEAEPPLTGLARQVYDNAKAVTVRIEARSKSQPLDGDQGSGVIIGKQGNTYYVATARHVVQYSDQEYQLITPDGRRYRIDYSKIKQQDGQDVALVQFSSNEIYSVATLADYRVQVNDRPWVFTAGWPKGESLRNQRFEFTPGLRFDSEISSFAGQNSASLTDGYEIVYSNSTQGGMSGGPVLDTQGRVVGIHGRAEGNHSEGVKLGNSLGIPTNTLLASLQLWGIERQWLQVETTPPPDLDKNQYNELIQALVVPLKKYPNKDATAKDWINYGNQLWRVGFYDLAVKVFNQAIRLDRKSYAAWYAKGLALSAADRNTEAMQSFEQAIEIDDKRYQEAQERGQEIDDRHYEVWRAKSLLLSSFNKYQEALASIDKAIQRNKQDAVLYILRAAILEELNQHQEAVEAYTKAIDIKPHPWVYNNRGLARSELGDLDGAIADYDQAIKLNPQLVEAYGNLGNIHYLSGDLDGAIDYFTEAIKINPQLAEAYLGRGVARSDSGDLSGAIEDYTEAIKLNPQDVKAYYHRGDARFQLGDLGWIEDLQKSQELILPILEDRLKQMEDER